MKDKKINEFRIEDNMIMEYYGDGGNLVIPDGVKDIFFEVFCGNSSITSVTIPGTIIELTPFAFERCETIKIATLNEGLTFIDCCAFNDCKELEIINLPKSLEHIGISAFSNCLSLKEIRYAGNKSEWELIIKDEEWNKNTGNYNVIYECDIQ